MGRRKGTGGSSIVGIVGTHPGSFRKSGKQRAYRIRNLEEDTEDGRGRRMMRERVRELNAETLSAQRRAYRSGMAEVLSISHDSR